MGSCDSKSSKTNNLIQDQNKFLNHKPILLDKFLLLSKSVCKIICKNKTQKKYGTGFFMIYNSLKSLITNYHIISSDLISNDIEIEIYNQKKINLKLDNNNRYFKFFQQPIDIAIIEIKDSDGINQDIRYFDYDYNYQKEYSQYRELDVIGIGYPFGKNVNYRSGKIIKVINDFKFVHDIPTEDGTSGSPIILFNTLKVIGIHNNESKVGTFIGIIINEINNDLKNRNNALSKNNYIINEENNYIIAEVHIANNDINKNIRIINSYEEYKRNDYFSIEKEPKEQFSNENEIKKCKIEINGVTIPFTYYYNFNNKGKYIIKYSFKHYLKNTNYMFYNCSSLKNIDLNHFNTQNVTNMKLMFCECSTLTNIILSNIITQNVTNMNGMFSHCFKLANLNLSSFNTNKVTDMSFMFDGCRALTNMILSNFNTQNVADMSFMFKGCQSLKSIDLSSFDTQNVIDMRCMFSGCKALTNINLSNFNTKNVGDMDLIFFGCYSLKIENLNTKDTKIMQKYAEKN